MASFTVSEAFHEGWALTKPNIWRIWGFALVVGAVSVGFNFLGVMFGEAAQSLMSLLGYLVSMMLSLGYIRVLLKLAEGKPVKLDDIFWFEGKAIWAYFVGSIIYSLIVFGGLLLFIIPGIIWTLMFGQYQYAIADKVMGTFESLKYSRMITKGNKLTYLGLGFVVGLMNIGAALLFLIPLIVTIPLSSMIMVWAYQKMSQAFDSQDKLEVKAS